MREISRFQVTGVVMTSWEKAGRENRKRNRKAIENLEIGRKPISNPEIRNPKSDTQRRRTVRFEISDFGI
jgi:hypothetical protein